MKKTVYSENSILIIGQTPPPYHGSTIMTRTYLKALSSCGYEVLFINKLFSRNISDIGKLTWQKIMALTMLIFRVIKTCTVCKPILCIYFMSSAGSSLIIDLFVLQLLDLFSVNFIPRFGGKGFKDLAKKPFWEYLLRNTLKKSLGGIVLGNKQKNDVNMFIKNESLYILPNCLLEDSEYTCLNCDDKILRILFLSNLIPSKGSMEFLQAARIALAALPNRQMQFIIAGNKWTDEFNEKLKSYVLENKMQEFVTFYDDVYGKEKEKLFATSHIFVFPTYYELETFGIVNLEAMRAGLPVISSPEEAIPDVVKNGETGFIVHPKDPNEISDRIIKLIEDSLLRRRMGIKGRERFLEEYSFEPFVKSLEMAVNFFVSGLEKQSKH